MDSEQLDAVVRRVLAGDIDAYEGVVEACQESVWRSVAGLLYDRDATQDLVQETFVKAYVALGSYAPGTSFEAWLRSIARNLARNRLRDGARRSAHLAAYREHVLAQPPEGELERARARAEALQECIARLPEHGARLVRLHYDEARPLADVAATIGTSVEAARQALWRFRVALRECIRARTATP